MKTVILFSLKLQMSFIAYGIKSKSFQVTCKILPQSASFLSFHHHLLLPIHHIPHTLFIFNLTWYPKPFTLFSNSMPLGVCLLFLKCPLFLLFFFSSKSCFSGKILETSLPNVIQKSRLWGQTPHQQKTILWSILSLEDQQCRHCIHYTVSLQH